MASVDLYCDGSAVGHNPGVAGCAWIIRYWDETDSIPVEKTIEGSASYRISTNNRMELYGCIYGFQAVLDALKNATIKETSQVNVMSDSEYLVKAFNLNWLPTWKSNGWMTSKFGNAKSHPVVNKDLWEKLLELQGKLKVLGINTTFSHVEGHAGNEFNEKCDQLAKDAATNPTNQLVDEAWESRQTRNG